MDDAMTLTVLSLAMFIGSYLAGSVPLAITFSEAKLKYATVFGAGLLVGTALAVIIPEGIHALIAVPHAMPASTVGNLVSSSSSSSNHHGDHDHHHGDHHDHEGDIGVVRWIGVSLVFGFVFMLLVDQIGGGHTDSGSHRHNITATLGLVVHAAADGIALGAAAASSSKVGVEIVIFAAIMLHKAPAAFGLVSFLLHEGFDRNRIRKHLLIFSFAAPLLALITYFCLNQTSKETLSTISATGIVMLFSGGTFLYVATVHILPELRLMGTTYVSTPHAPLLPLPILTPKKSGAQSPERPGSAFAGTGQQITSIPEIMPAPRLSRKHSAGFSNFEVFLLVLGCLLPLLLNIGHSH